MAIDQIVLSPAAYATTPPGRMRDDAIILPRSGVAGEIVLHAAGAAAHGLWRKVADATAAAGVRAEHPDGGVPKLPTALAAPANYLELTFTPEANRPYHLWVRGRAQENAYVNDSVYVQFSGSTTSSGSSQYRIGTSEAAAISLEDCSGCSIAGWMWQDNAYGGVGGPVYFATSQPQTIRIQTREDGVSLDQIVLSPGAFITTAPGTIRNDATVMARTR